MKKQFLFAGLLLSSALFAQKNKPANWQNLDPTADKVYGVGANEAYKLLKDKKSKTVIVGVIDSGVDPEHEDLKNVIWVNQGEIPNNGIDDDNNGYIDDVHGWNFIGGKNGDINNEATELARLYQRGQLKFANIDPSKLTGKELSEYQAFEPIKVEFEAQVTEQQNQLKSLDAVKVYLDKVKSQNQGKLTKDGLKNYTPENDLEKRLQKGLKLALTFGLKAEDLDQQIQEGYEQVSNSLKYNTLNSDSIRRAIVGDDVDNMQERFYGNNHYQGPDALHGTHVSGIIAAMRNNNLGIDGIGADVKIMILRAVPNGDERDKDIANAIRYAVDNGAQIINMSFGKYYSPNKEVVDEAIRYAQAKNVLLVHAAGNESKNNDIELSYPTRELNDGTVASNWIQVGASAYKGDKNIIGSFSNYGQKKVDLFAPGVNVYSTVPNNKYLDESGTSMASPSVAGVAALIKSYYPELSAEELKAVLMKTVVPYKKAVIVPGTKKDKKTLQELSISGGFVSAKNAAAFLLAQ